MAEVRLENVTKLYGRKRAISDVSFVCKEGEFLSILGPTGAGKSTILKMIAGIEDVTSGRIMFNGRVVNDVPPQERNVSMAFETYNLYPHMNVYDNIAFPLRAPRWGLKLSREKEREKVEEIANFLGIGELLDRLPQQLSGGQKQRVSLARALVRKPEVFLLDEPIAHLDARLKFTTQTLLKEFANSYRSTIVYVTHDYREALALSDRIIVLRKGRIEQEGSPEEVYYTPATDFVGRLVGEPPMNLVDGELEEGIAGLVFRSGESIALRVDRELVRPLKNLPQGQGMRQRARLGIRCEYVKVSHERISEDAFQLPIYAVVREAESVLFSFQIQEGKLLHARTRDEDVTGCEVGEKLWVEFDRHNMFFFPITTERATRL
ncbi:MAG: ABC transporter ATP-binding protein [Firmicutes bacterium]|nr:ABC transporter ATP-binding protein [Bacillota bacterium]MDH7494797.1 ABC transporter ATP-binding protein [Bacillota bacterium]